eukprot:1419335-Alexandrium_andersonii.AAC.1
MPPQRAWPTCGLRQASWWPQDGRGWIQNTLRDTADARWWQEVRAVIHTIEAPWSPDQARELS